MIDQNKFCVGPFLQVVCRSDGEAIPCCSYSNPGSHAKINGIRAEWTNLSRVRRTMMDGTQTDKICAAQCYDKERKGLPSERLGLLNTFGYSNSTAAAIQDFNDKDLWQLEFPKKVELHTSNLCNLKCLTCFPRDSSALLSENSQIHAKEHTALENFSMFNIKQSDFQYSDQQMNRIMDEIISADISILDLRGGETMMVPVIQEKLQAMPVQKKQSLSLRIQTNGTVLSDQWKNLLPQFRHIRVQFSIDAIEQALHYIRYPTDWSVIQNNLAYMRSLPNVDLSVSCVVSNLNLPVLDRFIAWADSEAYAWYLSTLTAPAIYQPNNLPPQLIQSSVLKIRSLNLRHPMAGGARQVIDYLSSMPALDDPDLWSEFCETIDIRDRWRSNSIFDIIPDLKQHWTTERI